MSDEVYVNTGSGSPNTFDAACAVMVIGFGASVTVRGALVATR